MSTSCAPEVASPPSSAPPAVATASPTVSARPAPEATSLPAACGEVGVAAFREILPTVPAVTAPPDRGTVITVRTASFERNGDASSVAALLARPGPDGISLPEAIEATNNSPGEYTIRFAPELKGATIQEGPVKLQSLTGGNVTINGDVDGDGRPDVTVKAARAPPSKTFGLRIESSGNVVHALAFDGFSVGVTANPQAVGQSFLGTRITNVVVRNAAEGGIVVVSGVGSDRTTRDSRTVWQDTVIAGNTVESALYGITFNQHFTIGNRVRSLTLNVVVREPRLVASQQPGVTGINLVGGVLASTQNRVEVELADNLVVGKLNDVSVAKNVGAGARGNEVVIRP